MKLHKNVTQLIHHNLCKRSFSQRPSKKHQANTLGISDQQRNDLLSQSKVEDSHLYFQSILNTRKKISNVSETNPINTVHELSDEYKASLESSALVWQKKKDKIDKQFNLSNIDRVINHTKLLSMKLPSKELENYLNACRIAQLLRLDPIKDKELIRIKKRIQWICMKHRLSAVPTLDFFLKHRFDFLSPESLTFS